MNFWRGYDPLTAIWDACACVLAFIYTLLICASPFIVGFLIWSWANP